MQTQNELFIVFDKMGIETIQMKDFLPAWNASLNALSFVFLCLGLFWIKKKNIQAHKKAMTSAVVISGLFLLSYLYYHAFYPPVLFKGQGWIRPAYFTMLISHIILAAINLPLVLRLLYFIYKDQTEKHKKLARIVWPIWAYVCVTGVLIYFCLYYFFSGEST